MKGSSAMPERPDPGRHPPDVSVLEGLRETLVALHVDVKVLQNDLRAVLDDVRDNRHAIRGNGSDGILARLLVLQGHVDRLLAGAEERARLRFLPRDSEADKIRWRAIGEIAIAGAALVSLTLSLLGG